MEKWEDEGMEEELVEAAEDEGGLTELAVPNEEGARLGNAVEEWYTGSDEERGRGRETERELPSDSLQDNSRE